MTELPKVTKTPAPLIGCGCEDSDARYTQFETEAEGCDETDGRYAQVTLQRCRACGRMWLHDHLEYECFSRSGRWAHGLIAEDAAATSTLNLQTAREKTQAELDLQPHHRVRVRLVSRRAAAINDPVLPHRAGHRDPFRRAGSAQLDVRDSAEGQAQPQSDG